MPACSKTSHLGGEVRGEDDLVAGHADLFDNVQLGRRRAVHAAAFLLQDTQDGWVGQRLDSVELLKVWKVRTEGGQQVARVVADHLLIVELQWRAVLAGQLLQVILSLVT